MEKITDIYPKFQEVVSILQKALNVSFSSALTETFDNLENEKIKVEEGAPDKETVAELTEKYRELNYENLPKDLKVQVFTLLALKSINEDGRNYNQLPTPSVIATIIALLWQKLINADNNELEVVDPAIGTGNLLYSVIRQLVQENHSKNPYKLVGIDNDETLLDLADVGAHLDGLKIELFNQDALDPWMVPPADIILSDIPMGYYPLDNNAKRFENHAKEGHSFAHLLFIEQIVKNLNKNGFAFLVVPKIIFTNTVQGEFINWLGKKVNIQAIIDLPTDMFANATQQKSILVFQNHGDLAKQRNVLVAQLPSLKDNKALIEFSVKLNEWYKNDQE